MKIVAFGDSITKGVYVDYRDTFCAIVQEKTGFEIMNRGVAGNNTCEALARLEQDVLRQAPDLVIVEFGMNDHFLTAVKTHQVAPNLFQMNLMEILNRIQALGTKTLLMTIQPVLEGDTENYYYSRHDPRLYESFGGANCLIEFYNQIIKECGKDTNSYIIDIAGAFNKAISKGKSLEDLLVSMKNSSMSDGVHPTRLGHQIYALEIIKTFIELGLYQS